MAIELSTLEKNFTETPIKTLNPTRTVSPPPSCEPVGYFKPFDTYTLADMPELTALTKQIELVKGKLEKLQQLPQLLADTQAAIAKAKGFAAKMLARRLKMLTAQCSNYAERLACTQSELNKLKKQKTTLVARLLKEHPPTPNPIAIARLNNEYAFAKLANAINKQLDKPLAIAEYIPVTNDAELICGLYSPALAKFQAFDSLSTPEIKRLSSEELGIANAILCLTDQPDIAGNAGISNGQTALIDFGLGNYSYLEQAGLLSENEMDHLAYPGILSCQQNPERFFVRAFTKEQNPYFETFGSHNLVSTSPTIYDALYKEQNRQYTATFVSGFIKAHEAFVKLIEETPFIEELSQELIDLGAVPEQIQQITDYLTAECNAVKKALANVDQVLATLFQAIDIAHPSSRPAHKIIAPRPTRPGSLNSGFGTVTMTSSVTALGGASSLFQPPQAQPEAAKAETLSKEAFTKR